MTLPEPTSALLLSSGEPGFANATTGFNLRSVPNPSFAATATTAEEVQTLVAGARDAGILVRVHSSGHGSNSAQPVDGGILIRTRLDSGTTVDPAAHRATIPAGATWGDVVAAAAPHGLAPLHGSSGSVGAIGYLLQGGVSFYGRQHGVAANSVVSITLVLADSSVATVDAEHDPELFWALRGGGGGFGIVVRLTVTLYPVDHVTTGATFWPASEAPRVLAAWQKWAPTAQRSVSTALRIMNLPPQPGIPPQLTAGPVVVIDGAALDDGPTSGTEQMDMLLQPLRDQSDPLLDTWHIGRAADVLDTHMDPPEALPFYGDHVTLTGLDADGQSTLLAAISDDTHGSLAIVELRQLGGALAESVPGGGAVDSLVGDIGLFAVGVLLGPNTESDVAARLDTLRSALAPWTSEYTVPSFVERLGAPQKSFDAVTRERVRSVRRRVDPHGLFAGDVTDTTP